MKDFCTVMATDKRKAYFALAWVSFFWGTTYLASKISAAHIPGLFIAGIRQFVSGTLLVGYFFGVGYKLPDKISLLKITIQGVLLLCISQGLLTWALEFIDSGLAAIIAGLMPLFVAMFSILLLRFARFTPLMIVGLVVGFGGIVTIFYEHFAQLLNSRYAFGIALSFIATISWSFGTVFASRYKPDEAIAPQADGCRIKKGWIAAAGGTRTRPEEMSEDKDAQRRRKRAHRCRDER